MALKPEASSQCRLRLFDRNDSHVSIKPRHSINKLSQDSVKFRVDIHIRGCLQSFTCIFLPSVYHVV